MTDSKEDKPKIEIHFAPGAFDAFEGTQEELDEFVAEVTKEFERMYEDGSLLENSESIDPTDIDEIPEEALAQIERFLAETEDLDDDAFVEYLKNARDRKSSLN